jgi:glutamine amidotransferase
MIAIIDYGVGNIKSIENALRFVKPKLSINIVRDADKLNLYPKIILPGVGAFGDAMKKVKEYHFDAALYEAVGKGKYLMGICLGMQMLATRSFEYGEHEGLNLIEGEVSHFSETAKEIRIPHIGWNEVRFLRDDRLLRGVTAGSEFYFIHSYYFRCNNSCDVLGVTEYGVEFPSLLNRANIYGAQFHPEKSQESGLKIIDSFLEL